MKRVHYSKQEESYLAYQGVAQLWQYADDARQATLPDEALALLRHTSGFAEFVEQLLVLRLVEDPVPETEDAGHYDWLDEEAPTEEPEDDDARATALAIDAQEMLGVAWRWHTDIAGRAQPMTGHYAHAFFMSWVSVAQLFYLSHETEPQRLDELRRWRAQDYTHYQRVAAAHTIEISALPLSMYSLQDLWVAVRLIVDSSFYRDAYSQDMKRYFYALFYRYCELISAAQSDIELVVDNPMFIAHQGARDPDEAGNEDTDLEDEDTYNAYKKISIPLTATLSLSSAYVYDGQTLFYSQFYRLLLSDRLATLCTVSPLRLRTPLTAEGTAQCMAAWQTMLKAVCQDPELAQFVLTDFKCQLQQLHLHHGETEQYKRHYPRSQASPNEVLRLMRASDHQAVLQIHATPLLEILKRHCEQEDGTQYEHEVFYMTRQATARWFAFRNTKGHKALMEFFVMEQLVSLEQLDALTLRGAREPPLLLSLMRVYYVVEGEYVYRASDFVHAHLLWLSRLWQRGLIEAQHIHPALRPCIPLFDSNLNTGDATRSNQ